MLQKQPQSLLCAYQNPDWAAFRSALFPKVCRDLGFHLVAMPSGARDFQDYQGEEERAGGRLEAFKTIL